MKVLITGACGVTSRAVARSLRLSRRWPGLQLVGTDICDNPYGLYEGLFDRIHRCPRVDQAGYERWMTEHCARERVDAAIVIPELEVLYWSSRGFPVPALLPPPAFSQIAVSKGRLYQALAGMGLVPAFRILTRDEIGRGGADGATGYPCWIRDFGEGTSSGKGALLVAGAGELHAWLALNPGIGSFMLSEYLPGRNYACHLLYDRGRVVKVASYERIEYFMARTAVSGVTGNISKGRLVNDARLTEVSATAVGALVERTKETMHGLVAVDLREAADGRPMITEINLRHVAATYSFAAAGFNLAESHLLLTLGERAALGEIEATYPPRNRILRDIDGPPVWVADFRELAVGDSEPR